MATRPLRRPRPGELAILICVGLLALTITTGKMGRILEFLYSPYTAFLAVVMIVEYVVLKGADRSSLYRRGMEAAREKRQEDLLTFRTMEILLRSVREDIGKIAEETESSEAESKEAAGRMSENVDLLLDHLRSRI